MSRETKKPAAARIGCPTKLPHKGIPGRQSELEPHFQILARSGIPVFLRTMLFLQLQHPEDGRREWKLFRGVALSSTAANYRDPMAGKFVIWGDWGLEVKRRTAVGASLD
jgi:hypothetical protein